MRNDPLIPVPKITPVHEPLPSQKQRTSELPEDTRLLEQLAELVAWVLKKDDEEDFEKALQEIEPLPKSVILYETVDLLGCYNSEKKTITIDPDNISSLDADMRSKGENISERNLEEVVEIHEGKHALHHLAQDSSKNNRIWNEFSNTPSYILEILAQLFTYNQVQTDPTLKTTFLELEKYQPTGYGLWRFFKYLPEEALYWRIRDEPSRIQKVLEKLGFILPPKAIHKRVISKIAVDINDDSEGKIHAGDIPDVVNRRYPYPAISYPGKPANEPEVVGGRPPDPANSHPENRGNKCFETAFFFSLTARRYANPDKGHLSFRQMLGCLVRHMKGNCGRITKQVFIFSDNWEADAYDEWKPVIDEFRDSTILDVCLILKGNRLWFRI